ncbi:hypothetical protein [Streptomyces sp. F001]|uniref:hypothetical protein n=1 Tax=Streptomyces sp. F001 TaxID=1510026 RepID=UPI0019D1D3F7|nr:hypothetical protein [Streptomyces sp. F001]
MSSPTTSSTFRVDALCGALSGLLITLPALVEAFTGETSATSVAFALSPCRCSPGCNCGSARPPAASGTSPAP